MYRVFLNTDEASDFLRISKSTIYKKVRRKEIPHHKLGRRTLFEYEELRAFVMGEPFNIQPVRLNEFDFPTLRVV
jgi:excisionase family DNA binding protein